MFNPYLDEFLQIDVMLQQFELRRQLVSKYSWAIPDENALKVISKYSPIVEVGAGTGYWASLLQFMDVDITPFDAFPPNKIQNVFHDRNNVWTNVHRGGAKVLSKFDSSYSLMLCWPPYNSPMAMKCLSNFNGDTLIYIGESGSGCTGSKNFHRELELRWERVEFCPLHQWVGLHDGLYVYRRIINNG